MFMKASKVICIFLWVLLTIFYLYLLGDTGRAIGAQSDRSVDLRDEYITKERTDYMTDNGAGKEVTDALNESLSNIDDAWDKGMIEQHSMEKIFKTQLSFIGYYNVFYIALTLLLYHFAFRTKEKTDGKDRETT